jgi:hypothetical protein
MRTGLPSILNTAYLITPELKNAYFLVAFQLCHPELDEGTIL